jgi:serine/threonine protein phosphatase PrpC
VQVRAARQRAVSADNSESIAQQIAETLVMRAKIAKAQDNVTALAIDFFSVEQPRAREPVLKK